MGTDLFFARRIEMACPYLVLLNKSVRFFGLEFDVPAKSLLQGGKDGWFKMIGSDASKSQQFMLNKQGGEHLSTIKNIEVLDRK